jgi:transposase
MLSDAQWGELEPLIEACRPKAKTPPKELRRTISAILWRHQNGAKWRAIPEELGPWWQAAQIFIRWARAGVWERLLDRVQERGVALGMVFLDGSNVRAHQKAAGAAKRMARPVRKWLGSAGLCSLHKRIRPSGSAVGQDGDPRVLGLIKGSASSAIFAERLPEHRSTVRPSSSHRPQTSKGRRVRAGRTRIRRPRPPARRPARGAAAPRRCAPSWPPGRPPPC